MTLLGEAVRSILLNDSTVSNMIGTRIYPLILPSVCDFPAITYSFPSNPYQRVIRGARCQIDCWSKDYTECNNLKNVVETALDGYSNTVGTINIEGIFPISPYDIKPDDTGLFHIPYDFSVIYRH